MKQVQQADERTTTRGATSVTTPDATDAGQASLSHEGPESSATGRAANQGGRHLGVLSFAGFLLLWVLLTSDFHIQHLILPPPGEVLRAFAELIQDGSLGRNIAWSLGRVLAGFLLGTTVGVLIGILMGWFRTIEELVNPPYQFIRAIPPMAFIPLFILWWGVGELPKLILMSFACAIVMIINVWTGVRNVPRIYVEAARSLGADTRIVFARIVLPAALPYILAGYRIALGIAWAVLVTAELIAAQAGLGFMVAQAREFLRTDIIFVGIIVIGVFALAMDALLHRFELWATRWMERARS